MPTSADPVVAEVNGGANQPPKFFHPSVLLALWIFPVFISPASLRHKTIPLTCRMPPSMRLVPLKSSLLRWTDIGA